jgi:hypothetical protein
VGWLSLRAKRGNPGFSLCWRKGSLRLELDCRVGYRLLAMTGRVGGVKGVVFPDG